MSAAANVHQFCTFFLGEQLFGIDVLQVQEVMRKLETTEVPVAPPVIRGLMNLRGSIVSCLDLRVRFGMAPAPAGLEAFHVVTQSGGRLMSLEVDRIGDVVEVNDARFEPLPPTLKGPARRLIDGVYKLNGALLQVVNVERLLDLEAFPN